MAAPTTAATLGAVFCAQVGLLSVYSWFQSFFSSANTSTPAPAVEASLSCPACPAPGFSVLSLIAASVVAFVCGVGVAVIYLAFAVGSFSLVGGAAAGAVVGSQYAKRQVERKESREVAPYQRSEPGDSESD